MKFTDIVNDLQPIESINIEKLKNIYNRIRNKLVDFDEPPILEFDIDNLIYNDKTELIFVGDTHGDIMISQKIATKKFLDNTDNKILIFLGDYVDRSPPDLKWGAINNVTYLLLLKLAYPSSVFLLQGNHESYKTIPFSPYQFGSDLIKRFGTKDGTDIHNILIDIFTKLPLMVRTSNGIFASHGGILKGASLDDLRKVSRTDKNVVNSIAWSDPVDYGGYRGPFGDHFTAKDLKMFLSEIGSKVMIRGHDYRTSGFSIYDNTCLTIFSSRIYSKQGNGGVLFAKFRLGDAINNGTDIDVENVYLSDMKKYVVRTLA
jgi:hypothetical protein